MLSFTHCTFFISYVDNEVDLTQIHNHDLPDDPVVPALPIKPAFDPEHLWTLLALSKESATPYKQHRGKGRFKPGTKAEQQARVSGKVSKWMEGVSIAQEQVSSHCGISYTEAEITGLHMTFHQRTQEGQREFLFNNIKEYQMVRDGNDAKIQTRWSAPLRDHDHSLCSCCWRELQGHIDAGRYKRAMIAVKTGAKNPLPRSSNKQRPTTGKTMSASAWLKTFGKDVGDFMPNENMVQLPAARVQELYGIYVEELAVDEEKTLSRQAFGRMMRKEQIKYACKQMKKFSKCNECSRLDVDLQLAMNTPLCAVAKANKEVHRVHVTAQKAKYYKHKQKGKSPRTCKIWLSIIIDGMDQAKTCIPRLHRNPKNLDGHDVLNVHLTGVIIHGHLHQLYTWVDNFPKDSNVTATVLLEALKDLQKIKGPKYEHPRNLYLQLDNCSGENKNRFFLTFLALLIQLGVFDRIKLSFLQVGHTHEDIDQLFSRLSTLWVSCDIFLVDQLIEIAQTVHYQSGTMKEMAAKHRSIEKENNIGNDEKEDEDGSEEEGDETKAEEVTKTKQPMYKLGHRHLTEIADINTWSENVWKDKQWYGTSQFRCFDFRREQVDDLAGGDPIVRCRIKVRRCMCSEGDPQCDESMRNYWQPRQSNEPDGVILFGDDEKIPKVKNISTVLRKTLPIDRKTISSYFDKLPARYIKKRRAQVSDDDEEGVNDMSLKKHVDRVHANTNVSRGMNWFSDFFHEQETHTQALCEECRNLKTKEAELKSKETSLLAARLLRKSMREQQMKDKVSALARRLEGKNPQLNVSKVVVSDKDDDESKADKKLRRVRRKLRELVKDVKKHVRITKGDALHQFYNTGTIFGKDNDDMIDSSDEDNSDEGMEGDDQEKEAAEEDIQDDNFIIEDEHASEFRVGRAGEFRKVHNTGCLVGDLVVLKSGVEDVPFYVGKLLKRCPNAPLVKFIVQWYGNSQNTFDKSYLPGWLAKDGDVYYSLIAKMRHQSTGERDPPYTEDQCNKTIITWSCDWKLTKKHFLTATARKRVEQTPGVNYVAPSR